MTWQIYEVISCGIMELDRWADLDHIISNQMVRGVRPQMFFSTGPIVQSPFVRLAMDKL